MVKGQTTIEVTGKPDREQQQELLRVLKERFEKNMNRHRGLKWEEINSKLETNPDKLRALFLMEQTGGEPDVVGRDKRNGALHFVDCSPESPEGRRNTCYDREGQESREKKGIHPDGNALGMAAEMGIELLDEEQYRDLQKFGEFDTRTSSWIKTPPEIRKLGGALFADRRYDNVFVYHNGAQSFYGARGFRGRLTI